MVIIALMISTIGLSKAQNTEKFYVYEARVTRTNAIVYEKCYQSTFTINRTKHYVEIKTDSVTFKEMIVKRSSKSETSTYTVITGLKTEIHVVREVRVNDKYYLVVQPILLANHNKRLGGYGLRLIISSEEDVWNQIEFTISNRK